MNDSNQNDGVRTCNNNNVDPNNTTADETQCPWWINSAEHGNCLWTYIEDKSGPDGSMNELVQLDIARLLGWSNTKTHFAMKQAMVELIDALRAHKANQLLSSDPDYNIEVSGSAIDPVSNYGSDDED